MSVFDRFSLDGRSALVAGGSGGIGVQACAALAGAGARVAIVGRSRERMEDARRAVEAHDHEALLLTGDMTVKADADRVVEEAVGHFGGLDIVVNAVGGGAGTALHAAEQYPEDDWH